MIDLAIQYAESEPHSSNYYVLLLISDGDLSDYNETVDLIIKASALPLSIITIGVGHSDFDYLQKLDSDGELLKSDKTGEQCLRDIVDFIQLENFRNK